MNVCRADYIKELKEKDWDLVINCSVLEHLRSREDIYDIFNLVNKRGILAIHTLICEEVPRDSHWYYIEFPVHCTLWTNKAMEILYNQFGYAGCAYYLPARMWFFFKDKEKYNKLKEIYSFIEGTWNLSETFVDYWKQKPYR